MRTLNSSGSLKIHPQMTQITQMKCPDHAGGLCDNTEARRLARTYLRLPLPLPLILVLLLVLLLATSCSESGLGRTWAAPDEQQLAFKKLAVVALTKQEVYRIQAEDALVQEMHTNSVASHTLLPGLQALRDTAAVVAALRAAGCDGLVTLQLKSGAVKPDPHAKPVATTTTTGEALDDYWVDPSMQETHSFAAGQYFAVEVHVFDLVKGKKVWDGLAVEQDARDVTDLITMVRDDVVRDLRKRGLIAD